MHAVQMDGDGFVLASRDAPASPGEGMSLVRVAAAGLNHPDVLQAKGLYPAPKGSQPGLGLEVAGTVVESGPETPGTPPVGVGEAVMGLTNGGGLAEFALVPSAQLIPLAPLMDRAVGPPACAVEAAPPGADPWMVAAASVPESGLTAWANLVGDTGAASPGGVCLVHGGAGGLGGAACFVARRRHCAVVATARGHKASHALAAGADMVIDYTATRFRDVLRDKAVAAALRKLGRARAGLAAGPGPAGGGAVTAVLDIIGGPYVQDNMAVCAPGGTVVSVAFQAGSKIQELDLMPVMLKRLALTGSTLRSRSTEEKASVVRSFVEDGTAGAMLRRDDPPAAADAEGERSALQELAEAVDRTWPDGGVHVAAEPRAGAARFVTECRPSREASDAFSRLVSKDLVGKSVLVF